MCSNVSPAPPVSWKPSPSSQTSLSLHSQCSLLTHFLILRGTQWDTVNTQARTRMNCFESCICHVNRRMPDSARKRSSRVQSIHTIERYIKWAWTLNQNVFKDLEGRSFRSQEAAKQLKVLSDHAIFINVGILILSGLWSLFLFVRRRVMCSSIRTSPSVTWRTWSRRPWPQGPRGTSTVVTSLLQRSGGPGIATQN